MPEAVTLPHLRPYRGPTLGAIWAGCIVGSWALLGLMVWGVVVLVRCLLE